MWTVNRYGLSKASLQTLSCRSFLLFKVLRIGEKAMMKEEFHPLDYVFLSLVILIIVFLILNVMVL